MSDIMLHIKNGIVIDPKNGVNAEKMDIFVKNGKIVEESEVSGEVKTIDASNKLVVAGGFDMHAHIAGSKINVGREMRPEEMRTVRLIAGKFRASIGRVLLTSPAIGYEYAKMGYTTAFEAAQPPVGALHTHEELDAIPMIDKAALPVFGNWHFVLKYVAEKDFEKLRAFIAWALERTKGFGVKVVNPGGVEAWMYGGNCKSLDDEVPGFGVTPREIITALIQETENLNLCHSVHLHCNNLGTPGNYETTIESMKLASKFSNEKRQVLHVTHVQFNSYAGSSWRDVASGAAEVAKYVNSVDNITIDMGQPIFGHATAMTGDAPFQFTLHKLTGARWSNKDSEIEGGAGIVPIAYLPKNPVHALQWAIGLELGLLVDSDKVVLSTDYPNGGPFTEYPYVMAMLMSKKMREKELERVSPYVQKATNLPSIDVEKTLYEVIHMTRSLPARVMGMDSKGHLGVGADADIAIYDLNPLEVDPSNDFETVYKAFKTAVYTIKGGEIIAKEGELVKEVWGRTFWVDARNKAAMDAIESDLDDMFEKYYSLQRVNYGVEEAWIKKPERLVMG
ncbi:formylmethanofuran dehydrogenase, subunit A [Archaeoglobus sulfaticallidus PM70-1]|uniref:Formylmethanofuran dehydrogenase, subunit A n=1 Tax=Archaeoglobus sulfaticallidus PM70-1 TaxID=387631 RepID=N0BLY6_9EURY|nr:formylmethanofuran dehydrogenase subunit A [Archaeoglobus sulfaticallidus]AGK61576.1 formylmethanofuran dehydrogenase, subunit A [Archaeoglobus sulfaticallidus PM70-1]